MLYLVYAIVGVNLWLKHGEIESDDLTSCSLVMVELSTRKREIREDVGNHHEKLGLHINLCASQLTIPKTAGTSPNSAGNISDTGSCKPNLQLLLLLSHRGLHPPYSSHLHPPSATFLSTTLPSLEEHKVKSSLCISLCHNHEVTPSTAYT